MLFHLLVNFEPLIELPSEGYEGEKKHKNGGLNCVGFFLLLFTSVKELVTI